MQFKWELTQLIIAGQKTQTRRPVKENERLEIINGKKTVLQNGRIKWQVGRDYAITYGRGKPTVWYYPDTYLGKPEAVPYDTIRQLCYGQDYVLEDEGARPLRIKLLDIHREAICDISHADTIAEGFHAKTEFWQVWHDFYGEQYPSAWVLKFEVLNRSE